MDLLLVFFRQLHTGAFLRASFVTVLFTMVIMLGSRFFADFDSALIGYTFATLFALFGITYRYCVWITKPSTRRYWRRGMSLFFNLKYWKNGWIPELFTKAILSKMVVYEFVWKRSKVRYISHFLIAWGCILAAAVTFPLVWGWIHFEQGGISPIQTFKVIVFGFQVQELPLEGTFSWIIFHALIISAFMVIPGVMMAIYRRMTDAGEMVIQKFSLDLLPLIMLFLVAFSGLLLWINYEWLDGYYYSVLAQFHALTVIGTLIYLPFGKFFHIFQRPASLGIALYREILKRERQAHCKLTNETFAPHAQCEDLKEVLSELGFNYKSESDDTRWQEFSPAAKRMLIARAHAKIKDGVFF